MNKCGSIELKIKSTSSGAFGPPKTATLLTSALALLQQRTWVVCRERRNGGVGGIQQTRDRSKVFKA